MIPEIQLQVITAFNPADVDLLDLPYEDGQLPDDQARVLLAIAIGKDPREVLEIGTFFGHTTYRLANVLPYATIHTIDLPPNFDTAWKGYLTDFHLIKRRPINGMIKRPQRGRIVQHFADTMNWNFANAGSPTFFFIDGSHSYECVKNDSEQCFKLCKGRGVFLWHDAAETHPGILKLLEEWRALGRDVRKIAGTTLGILQ